MIYLDLFELQQHKTIHFQQWLLKLPIETLSHQECTTCQDY